MVVGGLAVIASIFGILIVLVIIEVWPLTQPPLVEAQRPIQIEGMAPTALAVDEHRTHLATLALDGMVSVYSTRKASSPSSVRCGAGDRHS